MHPADKSVTDRLTRGVRAGRGRGTRGHAGQSGRGGRTCGDCGGGSSVSNNTPVSVHQPALHSPITQRKFSHFLSKTHLALQSE